MMACWLAVRVARQPSTLAAVLAGVFLASAIHTHLFLVVFTPFVSLLYWAALPQSPAPPLARSVRAALLAAGGGAVLTLILASVNRATGGDWLFFLPQIEHSWTLSQPGTIWWLGLTDWIPSARHLIIPVLLMIALLPDWPSGHAVPIAASRSRWPRRPGWPLPSCASFSSSAA